jgi:hypothetical protein
MGEIAVQARGGVYGVNIQMKDADIRTRGVKITGKTAGKETAASEFNENRLSVTTAKYGPQGVSYSSISFKPA